MAIPKITINEWDELFENHESRKLKFLTWIRMPNTHDSVAYCRLMTRKDGPEIFAAWILLVQLASKCSVRSELISSDGRPYSIQDIAVKTRAPQRIFEKAIPYLSEVGWITLDPPISGESPEASGDSGNLPGLNGMEWKRMEENTNTLKGWCVIYDAYPRKVGKKDAQKPIEAAIKAKGFDELLEIVKQFKAASSEVEKRFIPHPATWFRQGRYDDDPSEWGVNAEGKIYEPPSARTNAPDVILAELKKQTDKIK